MFKRLYLELLCRLSPKKFAHKIGVKFGSNCRFIAPRYETFGSEPYLIEMGDSVSFSEGVRFITHDGAVWVVRHLDQKYQNIDLFGKITIGNNVFIGMGVTILPGVTIGNDCIIGAGSVVTKNVNSGVVVAGCPAKTVSTIENYIIKNSVNFSHTKDLSPKEKMEFIINEFK